MKRRTQLFVLLFVALGAGALKAQQASTPELTPEQKAAREALMPLVKAHTDVVDAGDSSPDAMAVLQLQRDIESHTVAGDVDWVSSHLANDFVMVHGDTWAYGKKTMLADTKDTYLQRVKFKMYLDREIAWSKVELHGDIAVVYGEYVAENAPGGTPRSWFNVWFERVFAKRNGQWYFLSHRTLNGPNYGPDRDSVLKIVHAIPPDEAK
jgi:Domain of unknown function (DUF4440)